MKKICLLLIILLDNFKMTLQFNLNKISLSKIELFQNRLFKVCFLNKTFLLLEKPLDLPVGEVKTQTYTYTYNPGSGNQNVDTELYVSYELKN